MALEHIKTDGSENGATVAQKVNLSFTQSDTNLFDITTKVNRNGDSIPGNLTVGNDNSTGELQVTNNNELGLSKVSLTNEMGNILAEFSRANNSTETEIISKDANGLVTATIFMRENGNIAQTQNVTPLLNNDLTSKFFVDSVASDLTTLISNNTAGIDSNFVAITQNATDIGNTNTDVLNLDTRVTTLEGTSFNFSKSPQVNDLNETTPQLIGTLSVPAIEAGTFMIGYSFAVGFGGVKDKSVHFRADINGSTGITYDLQSDKNSNHKNRYYAYPDNFGDGAFTLEFYMWKETGFTTQVDVLFCDLMLEKKA